MKHVSDQSLLQLLLEENHKYFRYKDVVKLFHIEDNWWEAPLIHFSNHGIQAAGYSSKCLAILIENPLNLSNKRVYQQQQEEE